MDPATSADAQPAVIGGSAFVGPATTLEELTSSPWVATAYDANGNVLATATTSDLLIQPTDPVNGLLSMPFRDERSRYKLYRGSMHLVVTPTGLETMNVLPMESYLRGVVPAEMTSGWEIEALKAQAVAARTYAWEHLSPNRDWDIVPTSANQNYGGYQHETTKTDTAVAATANQILTYNGHAISALYSSCAGGYTENSEYAFVTPLGGVGSKIAYLRGKPDVDPNGVAYDIHCPNFSWQTTAFPMNELSQILSMSPYTDVGQITNITYWRGVSGRVYKMYVEGTTDSKYMSGARFRNVFNANKPQGTGSITSNMFYLVPVPT